MAKWLITSKYWLKNFQTLTAAKTSEFRQLMFMHLWSQWKITHLPVLLNLKASLQHSLKYFQTHNDKYTEIYCTKNNSYAKDKIDLPNDLSHEKQFTPSNKFNKNLNIWRKIVI